MEWTSVDLVRFGAMATLSLGYRSDLMMLGLQGGHIDQRDGHVVVRSPANPLYHWGNFVLLSAPPAAGTIASWIEVFEREFPGAEYVAFGVDDVTGDPGDEDELAAAGLDVARDTVMTAGVLRPPPHPNGEATVRILNGDEDWNGALALTLAINDRPDAEGYRKFAQRRLELMRRLQDRGCGAWFGAFLDGRLVSNLGVFTDGSGLARYQNVATHPGYRNRGLAGTLAYTAGRHALDTMGAHTLVIVADPADVAIRVYRSLGFVDAETQVQLYR
jgi:RimJ/RimL family protein N-acetyltransferase